MEIKTRWHKRSDYWCLESEINFDSIFMYSYLASISYSYKEYGTSKKIYVVTDLFDEYPDPSASFGDRKFERLKDAKAWAQRQVMNGLKQMIRDIKKLK